MKKVDLRTKNQDGKFRVKRWDTKIWTIEKKYWMDFGVRSDMKLTTYLKKNWYWSLSKLIEHK